MTAKKEAEKKIHYQQTSTRRKVKELFWAKGKLYQTKNLDPYKGIENTRNEII
jgi:hypothetical protein